jgi:hypothetical protein
MQSEIKLYLFRQDEARDYPVWRSARRYEYLSVTRWRMERLPLTIQGLKFGVSYSVSTARSTEMARVSDDVSLGRLAVYSYECCNTSSLKTTKVHSTKLSKEINHRGDAVKSVVGTSGMGSAFDSRLKGGGMTSLA